MRQLPGTPQASGSFPSHAQTWKDLGPQSRATPTPLPARLDAPVTPSTPISGIQGLHSKKKGTLGGKKAVAAEKKKLALYAQELFVELNRLVFKDGLPTNTKLNWNKRLLTTAGRARWHRYGLNSVFRFVRWVNPPRFISQSQGWCSDYRDRVGGEDPRLRR